MEDLDVAVIGAGVIGLAVARALAQAGREVVILEREATFGTGISTRNSEVLHAGLYYPTDSLRARVCAPGHRRLYAYCAERGIAHRKLGKLLVAADAEQAARLGAAGLAAGAWSADAARPCPRLHLAKGNYFCLSGRAPFSRLIYPLPVPGGLGVHLTLDLAGRGRFGPDVEWMETETYTVDPCRGDSFYAAIRRYWPGLPDGALAPDTCGIRPKITGPGEPAADFWVATTAFTAIALSGLRSEALH